MKYIIAAIMALAALGASAEGPVTTMGAHLGTYHDGTKCIIGSNPGAYAQLGEHIIAGIYHNSCGRFTQYVGVVTDEWRGLSVVGAIATGYMDGLRMAMFPSLRIPVTTEYSARFSGGYMPISGVTVVHLSVEKKF